MLTVSAINLSLSGTQVLRDISFSQHNNEVIGVIGPNGAGKSSLLRLIQGELKADAGQIILNHQPLMALSANQIAKHIAVVSQTPALLFELTAEQVVTMGLLPHKSWFERDTAEDRKQVQQALVRVGLGNKTTQQVNRLSGGEQQRVFIARALVQKPSLLLLDEPTNHLDVLYQHQILQLVRELKTAVIACLHDLNLAALYCDKILLLHSAEQIAFGTPEEVLEPALLQQVFGLRCVVNHQPLLNKRQITFLPPMAEA